MSAALQSPQFTCEQVADLAQLFVKSLTRGNIISLATNALGRDALQETGNDLNDLPSISKRLVQIMLEEGRLSVALAVLRREAHANSQLAVGLNHILQGRRLGDDGAMQAFVNDYEPFVSSANVQTVLPRIIRSICAVWLGPPHNRIVGTGFLIGADYVLTNFHVIEPMLNVVGNKIEANAPGKALCFIFDYLTEPAPRLPPAPLPGADSGSGGVVVFAADKWLIHARGSLPNDGKSTAPEHVETEFDYAVVKLAAPIGLRPTLTSGGVIRGWLSLPEEVQVLVGSRRIMLFQHPGAAAQQFDMGDFLQVDLNRKRVWYRVSAARGSSGGAAVDSDGTVFALHNAEVECPPAPPGARVNQGVRIDVIARDLVANGWANTTPPDGGAFEYWSLTDDVADPRPIIGRSRLREYVRVMSTSSDKRVLVVTGPTGSGVRFSAKLLRRLWGPIAGFVQFSRGDLENLTPERFLRTLVNALDITDTAATPIPPAPPTESMARWLRLDLPRWLAARIAADERRNRGRYPAWVVLDAFVGDTQRLLWADNLKELVAALVGEHDPGQSSVEIPQLRWAFLVGPGDTAPAPYAGRNEDDLREQKEYTTEFAECMQLAWRCVESRTDGFTHEVFKLFGGVALDRNVKGPETDRLAPRKALATFARELFLKGRPEGGP